jgi:hypothetical protein
MEADGLEQKICDSRYDARLALVVAKHGEGLAAASLTVGEDAGVVPVDGLCDAVSSAYLKHVLLGAVSAEHTIKLEVSNFLKQGVLDRDQALIVLMETRQNALGCTTHEIHLLFLTVEWSEPGDDLDAALKLAILGVQLV